LAGRRRREEGGRRRDANIAQSHQIYSAHRVAHRVLLVKRGGRRERGGGRREEGGRRREGPEAPTLPSANIGRRNF